jgi:exopolysaccharide production protein ExoZ
MPARLDSSVEASVEAIHPATPSPVHSSVARSGAREQLDTVQALRALAAVCVVGMHIPAIEHGGFGVDLFFIISGFIVCHVAAADPGQFMLKRVFRVVPLYWLCTLALFGLALAAPQLMGATRGDFAELVKSLLFVPFAKSNGNVHPLLYLGWTLNYEMLFYALFALSLALAPRRAHALAVALLLVLFGLGQVVTFDNVALAFWTAPIVIEFVFGIAAYHVWRSGALARLPRLAAVVIAVGAWLFLAAVKADDVTRPWLYGLPALAIFLAVLSLERRWRVPAVWLLIGNASYSLYLTHAYVIQALQKLVVPLDSFTPTKVVLMLLAVVVCCAFATACFRLIERPSNLWLRRRFLPRKRVAPAEAFSRAI